VFVVGLGGGVFGGCVVRVVVGWRFRFGGIVMFCFRGGGSWVGRFVG